MKLDVSSKTNKKEKNMQITNIRNEIREISTDLMGIKRMIKDIYAHKFVT
jgi:hypothetical protein